MLWLESPYLSVLLCTFTSTPYLAWNSPKNCQQRIRKPCILHINTRVIHKNFLKQFLINTLAQTSLVASKVYLNFKVHAPYTLIEDLFKPCICNNNIHKNGPKCFLNCCNTFLRIKTQYIVKKRYISLKWFIINEPYT